MTASVPSFQSIHSPDITSQENSDRESNASASQEPEYHDIVVPDISLGLTEDDIKYLNPLVPDPMETLTRLPQTQFNVTEGGMHMMGLDGDDRSPAALAKVHSVGLTMMLSKCDILLMPCPYVCSQLIHDFMMVKPDAW